MKIPSKVAKYCPPMPLINHKKHFTQGNPQPGPTDVVGTFYIALRALGEATVCPFGPAHGRVAFFKFNLFVFLLFYFK